MAQEFFNAFGKDGIGVCGNDTTLASADVDGINMIAIQALEKRTSQLQKENEQLRADNSQLKSQMNDLAKIVHEMKITMANLQKQNKNNTQNITLVNNQ
jgi:TolA-binding protein